MGQMMRERERRLKLTFHPQLLDVRLDGRDSESHRQSPEYQESNEEDLPAVPLDVAAQREQEGLEPRPDPQRSFLTYGLPLESEQEGGQGKRDTIIIGVNAHKQFVFAQLSAQTSQASQIVISLALSRSEAK